MTSKTLIAPVRSVQAESGHFHQHVIAHENGRHPRHQYGVPALISPEAGIMFQVEVQEFNLPVIKDSLRQGLNWGSQVIVESLAAGVVVCPPVKESVVHSLKNHA